MRCVQTCLSLATACLFFAVGAGAQGPSTLVSPSESVAKAYFGDQKGRFFLDVTGWTITPASQSPDGKVRYKYDSGGEVWLTVETDVKTVGDPFVDPIDRADTIKDQIAALQWADAKILQQKVVKVGDFQALDVTVSGTKKMRYKARLVFIQQDGALHRLCFTSPSSDYEWLRRPVNSVVESYKAGKPPLPLMGSN